MPGKILFISTILLFWASGVLAQVDSLNPIGTATIVEIIRTTEVQFSTMDSMDVIPHPSATIGEALSRTGQLNVLISGAPGSAQQARQYGLSPDHTAINWNGIPIHSITLGGTDMALMPSFMFDEVDVYPGSNSLLFASSSFGGAIDVKSKAKNHDEVLFMTDVNSMNNSTYGGRFSLSKNRLKYTAKGVYSKFNNHFSYRDKYKYDSPEIWQEHNNANQWATIHDVSYQLSNKQKIVGGIWLGEKNNDIPEIMGSYGESFASQYDHNTRGYLSWQYLGNQGEWLAKMASVNDFQHYIDRSSTSDIPLIDSRIKSKSSIYEVSRKQYLGKHHFLHARLRHIYGVAETGNYSSGSAQEHRSSLNVNYKGEFRKIILLGAIANEVVDAQWYQPSWSLAINKSFALSADGLTLMRLKLGISRKFRLPDFNERFWQPGGNPMLFPEKGYQLQGAADFEKHFQRLLINAALSYQGSQISDWIEWVNQGDYFAPQNLNEVMSHAGSFQVKLKSKQWGISSRYTYSFGFVEDHDVHYLSYNPTHAIHSKLTFSKQGWVVCMSHQFTGEYLSSREGGIQNTMPQYQLFNINLNKSFQSIIGQFTGWVYVNNLLDAQYEMVKSYAMPGRVLGIGVQWKYLRNK